MPGDPRSRALTAFEQRFGGRPEWLARAPGRVSLLGAHVDYVEGWVLPAAIDRAVYCAARPARGDEGTVEALDLGLAGKLAPGRLPAPLPARGGAGDWLDLPRGVAWALASRGATPPALDLVLASDIPMGAGLSSSAAVEVALLLVWEAALGIGLGGVERARLGRRVENEYLGVASGIMDQYASIHGRTDHLMLLDCRSLEHDLVPLPPSLAILVFDSGVRRTLAGSSYNDRPAECRRAAELLRRRLPAVRTLRDVTPAELERHGELLPSPLLERARHSVRECRRVRDGAAALGRGDVVAFGAAMRASHESSRDLYQVSIAELDLLAAAAWESPGCYGARLMGAGFGGCVAALVDEPAVSDVTERVASAFGERFGRGIVAYPCRTADGAALEVL